MLWNKIINVQGGQLPTHIPLCSHPYFGRLESVLQFNNACAKFAMPQGWPFFFSITGLNCVYWGGDQNLGVQLTLFKGGGGGQGGLDYALNITAYIEVTYV